MLDKYVYIFFAILFPLEVSAQCSLEKQKEIKLSGKFYYGESTDVDTSKAKFFARDALMQNIAANYLEKKIVNFSSDSVVNVNSIMYCISKYGKKNKAIAFVGRDQFEVEVASSRKDMVVVKMPYSDDKQGNTNSNVAVVKKTSSSTATGYKTDLPTIIDTIIRLGTASKIEVKLHAETLRNRVEYTSKENLVVDKADCYILFFDKKTSRLVACLSKGGEDRTDFLSNKVIKDYKNEFQNFKAIWLHVF